ncbi:hypothetical protein GQ600_18094 [Phytophthora cactorum]|nr:hypothetical protein GQ600_18094 [Phytophthora cactorum]
MPRLLHVSISLLQKLYMSKTNPKTNQEKALPEQNSIERIMHCMPVKSKQLNAQQQMPKIALKLSGTARAEFIYCAAYFERPPSSRIFDVEEARCPKASSLELRKNLRRERGTDTSSNTDIIDYSSNVTAQQAVDTSTHTLAVTSSEAESAAISESDITNSTVV